MRFTRYPKGRALSNYTAKARNRTASRAEVPEFRKHQTAEERLAAMATSGSISSALLFFIPLAQKPPWLRGFCMRFGGFEPDIAALANSFETLIGMVAAGRGVFVGSDIAMRGREESWRSAAD